MGAVAPRTPDADTNATCAVAAFAGVDPGLTIVSAAVPLASKPIAASIGVDTSAWLQASGCSKPGTCSVNVPGVASKANATMPRPRLGPFTVVSRNGPDGSGEPPVAERSAGAARSRRARLIAV